MVICESEYLPYAEISVKKLYGNLEYVTSILNGAKLFCVVKSDAYGHGMQIARYMDKFCYGFAVSRLDEAVALRYLGIRKCIIMLLPVSQSELRIAADYDVTLTCDSLFRLKQTADFDRKLKVFLKADTGMKRFGFSDLNEFESAVIFAENNKKVRVEGVYSHFYNAESNDDCLSQLKKFSRFSDVFDRRLTGLKHVSASGGLIRGYTLDAVRVGILCYGYKPFACDAPVKPVMKIYAKPFKKRCFSHGDVCLYNSFVSGGEFSLVNYGYADGLPRTSEPTRCMDVSLVKTTQNDVVFDDAEIIAKKYGTISYEVLTSCTKRIPIYYNEEL